MATERDYFFELKPKNTFSLNLKELIEYRELFYFFTWRDIKVKYRQTLLGFLWAILQPLLLMVIFSYFVGKALHAPSEGMDYPVFVFSGLMLWLVFSSGITGAGNSMVSHAPVIRKIYFPRLIVPLSSVLVSFFDFLVAAIVFIPVIAYFRPDIHYAEAILCWPAGVILTLLATAGPGILLAALNVKYRDFRYVIPFLVQLLLFVSPVIYPVSMISSRWMQQVMAVNPMYAAITVFRMPFSSQPADAVLLVISLTSGIFFLLIGLGYFRRTEAYFADLA